MSRDSKVFIGNVPIDCRESDLEAFFKGIGEIRDVVVKKNYAFCEFVDYYDAKDAVKEKDGEKLLGARVRVEFAKGEKSDVVRGGRGAPEMDKMLKSLEVTENKCKLREVDVNSNKSHENQSLKNST